MTIEETILVSTFSAATVMFLQYRHDRLKFFREKVLERYSLFVAVASSELQRAKTR